MGQPLEEKAEQCKGNAKVATASLLSESFPVFPDGRGISPHEQVLAKVMTEEKLIRLDIRQS